MVTSAANTLILNSVIAATLDTISVISVKNSVGEFFRKVPTDIEVISTTKKRFTFWLNENEGNDDNIVAFSLYGNGATTDLGSGTELVTQAVNTSKNNTQSLLMEWIVEVKQNV